MSCISNTMETCPKTFPAFWFYWHLGHPNTWHTDFPFFQILRSSRLLDICSIFGHVIYGRSGCRVTRLKGGKKPTKLSKHFFCWIYPSYMIWMMTVWNSFYFLFQTKDQNEAHKINISTASICLSIFQIIKGKLLILPLID